ncbi:MAG: cytidine deaminase [Bacteroidales bacterium]|nr:cytidine deaminase [Bacteroidales bacterium]
MNKRETIISYLEYQGIDELTGADRKLVEEAVTAASGAYAPYSHFMVGAAILLDDGTVIRGANVENAAFPSGSCAEKTALSYTVANHHDKSSVAIAIAALSGGKLTRDPVPPCGNCRQMLIEEEQRLGKPVRVILAGESAVIVLENCQSLMPLSFTRNNLVK